MDSKRMVLERKSEAGQREKESEGEGGREGEIPLKDRK